VRNLHDEDCRLRAEAEGDERRQEAADAEADDGGGRAGEDGDRRRMATKSGVTESRGPPAGG